MHDIEHKASQYADDTTLLLQEDLNSIVSVLKNMKWFKPVSGLEINKEKNNIVKIGASRGRSIAWRGKFGFKWATTFKILGIYFDINRMGEITELTSIEKWVKSKS